MPEKLENPRTWPINITVNKDSKCNLQCSYSFSYPPTSLKIYRYGPIYLIPDDTVQPPVIYNNNNYNVQAIYIFRPSLHKFAGVSADAEMIIVHYSEKSPKALLVCIPITKSSTSTTEATTFLDLIGLEISRTGTGSDGETVFNNPTFTLNKFVPMKPYISYSGSNGSEESTMDFIVFQKENSVYMSVATFNILTDDTKGSALWPAFNYLRVVNKSETSAIFYNSTGPVVRAGDSIYISCQPTGADGEILTQLLPNSSQMVDRLSVKAATNNLFVKVITGTLLMIIIWKLSIKIIRGVSGNKDD